MGWALDMGSSSAKNDDGSTWGQFCPLELRGIAVCGDGVKSYMTRAIQNLTLLWIGAGARQLDVTSTLIPRFITVVGEGGLSRDTAGD